MPLVSDFIRRYNGRSLRSSDGAAVAIHWYVLDETLLAVRWATLGNVVRFALGRMGSLHSCATGW